MLSEAVLETLERFVSREQIQTDGLMSKYTSFRVGGPASCIVSPSSEEQVAQLIRYLNLATIPYFVLGRGSNTIVRDEGFDGIVIRIGEAMSEVRISGNKVTAQAGASLISVARMCAEAGLSGLEFAGGIPGSVGGGVVMNAGAYDGEMSDVVTEVHVVTTDGECLILDNESMEFAYRHSVIHNRPFVVTEVSFELKTGDAVSCLAKIEEFNQRRRDKQPLEYPSAGSTFKRPEGYFAGELIMNAGLRGFQIGGARVSDKHCGFVVNMGGATAKDILDVMEEVQDRVKEKFGVELEPEVVIR